MEMPRINRNQNYGGPINQTSRFLCTKRARLEIARDYKYIAATTCALVGVALYFVPKGQVSAYILLAVAVGLALSGWRNNVIAHRCNAKDSKFGYKKHNAPKPSLLNRIQNILVEIFGSTPSLQES